MILKELPPRAWVRLPIYIFAILVALSIQTHAQRPSFADLITTPTQAQLAAHEKYLDDYYAKLNQARGMEGSPVAVWPVSASHNGVAPASDQSEKFAPSSNHAPNRTSVTKSVFNVAGDSLSVGLNPDVYGIGNYGWIHMMVGAGGGSYPPPQADTVFNVFPGLHVYNSAVSGSTTWQWVPGTTYYNNLISVQPDLVAIYLGTNDLRAYSRGGAITDSNLAYSVSNVYNIIEGLQALPSNPEIIVMGVYDPFDGLSNHPSIYFEYKAYSSGFPRYNEFLKEVAQLQGVRYIEIYGDFYFHGYGRYLGSPVVFDPGFFRFPLTSFDIHSNTAGYYVKYAKMMSEFRAIADGLPPLHGFAIK